MLLRRLHPEPGDVDVVEAAAGLAGREILALNMVASVDGRAAVAGRTAQLGDEADRALFHVLRAQADAVLVGAGTLRTERYGPLTKTDELRALRERAGLAPEPIAVTATRSMDLPWDIPLFQDPSARVVVFTSSDRHAEPCPADLAVIRMDVVTPREMLRSLRAEHGVACVVCEGGPTLNRELFAGAAVDELFLTLAPTLVGGAHPLTLLEGGLPGMVGLRLSQVLEHESALLLRYAVAYAG